ncbi:MAG: hypothetical protein ACI9R3_006134 [Verrucomicrobiales bacterium]|jgi:hypothetical protein
MLIAAVALFAAPTSADAGDFWDFLRNAWEDYQDGYQDDQASADELEDQITASAQQAGTEVSDPDQYKDYAEKLAKTLSKLTPEQQARVFNG